MYRNEINNMDDEDDFNIETAALEINDYLLEYLDSAEKLCIDIDTTCEDIKNIENQLKEKKKERFMKTGLSSGTNLAKSVLLCCFIAIIPVSILNIFFKNPLYYLLPFVTVMIFLILNAYYEKNVLSIVKKSIDGEIERKEKELNEKVDKLFLLNEYIPEKMSDIPQKYRYQTAIGFFKQIIARGMALTLPQAMEFYEKLLEEKKEIDKEKIEAFLESIKDDEEKVKLREATFKKYKVSYKE